ncbi:hypothetical protein [Clostridium sp. LP20]|uniref:hypothetical protein n=1 Tax=Clostridium sp. LP20 TaxID=3418665 RepID=UPI003EE4AF3A
MRDLKLAESFSIVALNGQDSTHMTNAKKVSLQCIAAAVILETYLDLALTEVGDKLFLEKETLNNSNVSLYQDTILRLLLNKKDKVEGDLSWWLKKASDLPNRDLKKLQLTMADSLKGIDLLEEIPSLLGCDFFYESASVSIKEYRSNMQEYLNVTESIRIEILGEGSVKDETIFIIWLLRESACLQDIFSKSELERVAIRINELVESVPLVKRLFEINIYHGVEIAVKSFLNMKKNAISSQTGTGINFILPMIERSQSIFIDTEEWFPNEEQRLDEVKARLEANGHIYTVIHEGKVPLLKIDNIIYEAIPEAIQGRIAIHGVRLRRYPI